MNDITSWANVTVHLPLSRSRHSTTWPVGDGRRRHQGPERRRLPPRSRSTGIEMLASLAAALEVAGRSSQKKTVFFLTSRQTQHRIVVDTVRRINQRRTGMMPVRLVDMVAAGMCVQPFAKESPLVFSLLCTRPENTPVNRTMAAGPEGADSRQPASRGRTGRHQSHAHGAWRARPDLSLESGPRRSAAPMSRWRLQSPFDDGVRNPASRQWTSRLKTSSSSLTKPTTCPTAFE